MNLEESYNNLFIKQHLPNRKRSPRAIRWCLPILKKYASMCDHITEMGVEYGHSTIALLSGYPKKMISYDIERQKTIIEIELLAAQSGIDYKFILGDSLKVNIEPTDLLFIDTLHTYRQLYSELNRHSNNVKNFILMHDTRIYGERDHVEGIGNATSKAGLMTAIKDFLLQNKNWRMKEATRESNGLVVLGKTHG